MGERGQPGVIRRWIINHEESWLFVVAYVVLAVVLSALISLFWLVMLVLVHLGFELVRHTAHHDSAARVWAEAIWDVKLDIGLLLFAFALTLYLDYVFGVLGLGTAARAAAAGSRFMVLQRSLRVVLLSVDDAANVVARAARGFIRGGRAAAASAPRATNVSAPAEGHAASQEPPKRRKGHSHHRPHGTANSWRAPWGMGGWSAVSFAVVSLALILLTPLITDHTLSSMLRQLAAELRPWN